MKRLCSPSSDYDAFFLLVKMITETAAPDEFAALRKSMRHKKFLMRKMKADPTLH
jgi:hypothetical protein